MANKNDIRKGYGKLLEAWEPPDAAGDPIGCVATSFTFSPSFFEEECLSRFLHLDTDPTEDGPLYLVEREEKLSQIACAVALVDQHHCQGPRSLRWDLLPIRVTGGFLHAKVSLLYWTKLVRVIIASANLTEDGYRRNQEVFGVLDFTANQADASRTNLLAVVDFLRDIATNFAPGDQTESPAARRALDCLAKVGRIARAWDLPSEEDRRKSIATVPLFTGPKRSSVFTAMADLWDGKGPPSLGAVYSPFFDPPGKNNQPAKELWGFLKQRGGADVEFYLIADAVPGKEGWFLHAPEDLVAAQPIGRRNVSTTLCRLKCEEDRPFHAKGLWLDNERLVTYMVGSSNFTTRGYGLGTGPVNLEANLVYIGNPRAGSSMWRSLEACFPPYEEIDSAAKLTWQTELTVDEVLPEESVPLPAAFGSATYRLDDRGQGEVELSFLGRPPADWVLLDEETDKPLSLTRTDVQSDPHLPVIFPWTPLRPPSGFWVKWTGTHGRAWWPVNVESAAALPPPEELQNLPLEVLINILTSSRPLHVVMRDYLKKRKRCNGDHEGDQSIVDPHRRVDTSQFLLQRTRRVSWALNGLRARLERPVATETCLHWRLRGPVGVMALRDALLREAHSEAEKVFLLSEVALELSRCQPRTAPGCLSTAMVRAAIMEMAVELKGEIPSASLGESESLRDYVGHVFAEIKA